ncbi:MAG: hypothetical protein LBI39_01440 [Puniceicoccales bacterium]|nr:hypothetical protein [Puniceicoccales bacterium]
MGESALTKLFDEEYDKLMAAVGGRNFRFVNAETYDAVIAGAAGSSARTFLNRAGLSCGNDGPIQKIVGEILSSIKCLPEYANRNTELKEISKRADWSSSVDYTSQDFSEEAKSHGIDTGANMDQIDEALDKYETTIGKLDDVERKEIISLANSVRELKEKPSPGKQVRLAKHIALSENGFRALCMIVGPHNIGIELKPYDEISKTRTAYFSYVKPETT